MPARKSQHHVSKAQSEFSVVGVGSSAGGLDALGKLLGALPADGGMAYILVQHLDPLHKSLMAQLLSARTLMSVHEAIDGVKIEPNHVYIIPPGTYLYASRGALRLTQPSTLRGARMPFDFLLQSLAKEYGARAICVVLSGSGSDGSIGLQAVKERGGFVVAQDPGEAAFNGMPESAIKTGGVNLVLPVGEIPKALAGRAQWAKPVHAAALLEPAADPKAWVGKFVELLSARTGRNFADYKRGTLQRRIEQRMTMAGVKSGETDTYLRKLESNTGELERLASDLLINVTRFFRDEKVFDFLEKEIIPDLVRSQPADRPLRIWVPGCSSGEEVYSLAMLFLEQIKIANASVKLRIFASDADHEAIAVARQGAYPRSIDQDVSAQRLARFFSEAEGGYSVSQALRGTTIFTEHDLLTDPPFSRLDMVSCRNLLIYLTSDAQKTVISHFHFALREQGILLLGSAETVLASDNRFELVSKTAQVYRHSGRGQLSASGLAIQDRGAATEARTPASGSKPARAPTLGEQTERLVIDNYAPASVLTNQKFECLYFLGPVDRFLRVRSGKPALGLLAKARDGLAPAIKLAVSRAYREHKRIVLTNVVMREKGGPNSCTIAVQPVPQASGELQLISFIAEQGRNRKERARPAGKAVTDADELERELDATKAQLEGVIVNLEASSDAQKSQYEELLSVNEEFQSTNEELLASKEELQSLNEELTSLNAQLQESLENQQKATDDLQNILSSTNVATLFLDLDFNIKFFTPATTRLFHIIPSDIGRPIADLRSVYSDEDIKGDARASLESRQGVDREFALGQGTWFVRRISPYRSHTGEVEGVVVTFTDITERKKRSEALEAARYQAVQADLAKSRFLAVASHDLRQPLQTLALIYEMLKKSTMDERSQVLLNRVGETLNTLTEILNTLLDINQIEGGSVQAEIVSFPIDDLLQKMQSEFVLQAQEKKVVLHVVGCNASVRSDPRLLEQVIRNLLSNAIKYTERGKILLGCRRREGKLTIEILDTGIGIPEDQRQSIFEEYYQIGNSTHEHARGLGLGLFIVQRLAKLLDHKVSLRSRPGKGSAFSLEVELAKSGNGFQSGVPRNGNGVAALDRSHRSGVILLVEDDKDVRELLELHLNEEGYRTAAAPDGVQALNLVMREAIRPDLIIADLNLPDGMDGLQVVAKLREQFQRQIPVIVLTGDVSTRAVRAVALQKCLLFSKPVNVKEMTRTIQRLLPISKLAAHTVEQQSENAARAGKPGTVFVIDDDRQILETISTVLEAEGFDVKTYSSSEAFLDAERPRGKACLLIDAYLPGISGLELLRTLRKAGEHMPAVMITGRSDVGLAVQAMKAGTSDFIEKPVSRDELLASVRHALEPSPDESKQAVRRQNAAKTLASLTPRQREIMDMIVAGHPNKIIAGELDINQRTVENHRASIMKKTGSKSLPALARLALAAAEAGVGEHLAETEPSPRG